MSGRQSCLVRRPLAQSICFFVLGAGISLGSGAVAETLPPVTCLITPGEVVDLASPVDGIVAEVLVERGDKVTAGQEVARLRTDLETVAVAAARARAEGGFAVAAAKARLAFLDTAAARNERLFKRNAVAESAVEEARMKADTARQDMQQAVLDQQIAEIELSAAVARLEQKILRSPIDGLVTARDVAPGEFRDGRSRIVTIAQIDVLRVEAFVPIAYFPFLALDQTVTIHPEDPIGGDYEARIAVIDHVFDAATGTLGVLAKLQNPDGTLPAGLRCEMTFTQP